MANFAVLQANYAKIVELIQARRIRGKLSIADQRPEERIAENIRKWSTKLCCEIHSLTLFMHPADTIHPVATVHLLFDASDFCYSFLFLSILSLKIDFGFGFFCNFPWL